MHTYDLTFFTSDMSCFHSSVLKVHKKYLYIITLTQIFQNILEKVTNIILLFSLSLTFISQ